MVAALVSISVHSERVKRRQSRPKTGKTRNTSASADYKRVGSRMALRKQKERLHGQTLSQSNYSTEVKSLVGGAARALARYYNERLPMALLDGADEGFLVEESERFCWREAEVKRSRDRDQKNDGGRKRELYRGGGGFGLRFVHVHDDNEAE